MSRRGRVFLSVGQQMATDGRKLFLSAYSFGEVVYQPKLLADARPLLGVALLAESPSVMLVRMRRVALSIHNPTTMINNEGLLSARSLHASCTRSCMLLPTLTRLRQCKACNRWHAEDSGTIQIMFV